jgi:hypothetical protein
MSIEIRELIIKATIVPDNAANAKVSASGSQNNNVSPNEALITMCVEKILEILKEKHGR